MSELIPQMCELIHTSIQLIRLSVRHSIEHFVRIYLYQWYDFTLILFFLPEISEVIVFADRIECAVRYTNERQCMGEITWIISSTSGSPEDGISQSIWFLSEISLHCNFIEEEQFCVSNHWLTRLQCCSPTSANNMRIGDAIAISK